MCREVSSSSPAFWPASFWSVVSSPSAFRSSSQDWLQDVDEVHQAIHKPGGGIWVRPMPSLSRSEAAYLGSSDFIGGDGLWLRAM